MDTRLKQFLKAENITQSQLAESIDVAPASISHILNKRNKPGFGFISKMAKCYPSLNVDWLLTGKGKMYNGGLPAATPENRQPVLFEAEPQSDIFPESKEPTPNVQEATSRQQNQGTPESPLERRVSKIVIFFDDNTFQEFV